MTIIEQNLCTIKRLNHQGLGIGQADKGQVELPFTLQGEKIRFTRHHYRGKSSFVLDEIVITSPHRITPFCQYFSRCGGCQLQHLDRHAYENFKISLIKNELKKANIITDVRPLIIIDNDQRRRVNLQFVKKKEQIYLGFYRFHSHQIINIESCPAALKDISALIIPLKQVLAQALSIDCKGQVFITKATNGLDMMLELKSIATIDADIDMSLLLEFAKNNDLLKLKIKNEYHQKIIYQKQGPYIEFDDIKVEIDYSSFLQANFTADKMLVTLITQYILSSKSNLRILDLFCGRGTFTFPLRKYGVIDGYEFDELAINSAKKAAYNNKINSINFFVRDLFNNPLVSTELSNYDLAIINPPRKGAIEQINALSKSKITNIIYISCNPQSFVRDANILISNNYALEEVIPIDQFYQTSHLEVIGFFKTIQ